MSRDGFGLVKGNRADVELALHSIALRPRPQVADCFYLVPSTLFSDYCNRQHQGNIVSRQAASDAAETVPILQL